MQRAPFTGNFTQALPIPEAGIAAAIEVVRSGRLHRYNTRPGELSETALLEREYASWQGARYCLAVASGGQAMQIALRAANVQPGDAVLTNAFTLAPVPGAITAVGARPVLVEIAEDLVIDLDDLSAKATASGARHLLLSNMRGHLCDMNRLMRIAAEIGLTLIEDCAQTMGAEWNGTRSGNFGVAGCFSTQTYTHLNSGEGGFLSSNDAEFMARAVMLSGSYMMYGNHAAAPSPEVFENVRLLTPNMSARMDNQRAALLRPQLAAISASIAAWNARHDRVAGWLARCPAITLARRPPAEHYVRSSIQFRIPGLRPDAARAFIERLAKGGVEVKWFGAAEPVGFTSAHQSWGYMAPQRLTRTNAILATLFDMRLPLTFSLADCDMVAGHICDAVLALRFEDAA